MTAVPSPLNINNAPRETIETIPGIGKKRAARILAKRPFKSKDEVINALDDPEIGKRVYEYLSS